MMLISDKYRAEQRYLHTSCPWHRKYGTGGPGNIRLIQRVIDKYAPETILDYGCGKGFMAEHVEGLRLYDPAIVEYSALPEPADLVLCMDVMEHIEPELLDNVMKHLISVTKRTLFVIVSLKYAGRILRDGRNAHLIVKPAEWWRAKFEKCGMRVVSVEDRTLEWTAVLER